MTQEKKQSDLEIAKMLMDERKRSIIDIAKNNPVTVSQMAERLNEKPSRLYYHVNKLAEAGLLKLVETRQQGNLIEKYYISNPGLYKLDLDPSLFPNDTDSIMEEIKKVLEPGLKLLAQELKKGDSKKQVDVGIRFTQLTGEEWAQSHDRMIEAIREKEAKSPKRLNEKKENNLSVEELRAKSKYAYFILSYRIDDTKDID